MRKSFLSTKHFCRPSILGSSSKTVPQRKTNEADEGAVVCRHLSPPPPAGKKTAVGARTAAGLIAGGKSCIDCGHLLQPCSVCSQRQPVVTFDEGDG